MASLPPLVAPSKTFKVLVIDGGGVRALYTLYLLKAIQTRYCKEKALSEYFDMIIGTSTGSLVAVGIGLWGIDAVDKLIKIYEDNSKFIFPNCWYSRVANWMRFFSRGHFYDNKTLIDIVTREMGDATMNQFNNLVCIPSYNLITNTNHMFRTPYDPECIDDFNILVKDAVLSSCAAPLYFDSHKVSTANFEGTMVDGGIWANNPTLVANFEYNRINKLLRRKEMPTYDNCIILNIGNIDDDRIGSPIGGALGVKNLIDWIIKSNTLFAEQFTSNEANVSVKRISSRIFFDDPNCYGLDDVNCLEIMKTLGKDHGSLLTDPESSKFIDLSMYFDSPKTFDVKCMFSSLSVSNNTA